MPRVREWQLFIDETGNFEDPDASVAVVGWLVQHREHPRFDADLRRSLAKVVPDAAWPPHAAHLNLPIVQPILTQGFGAVASDGDAWVHSVPDAWARLRALEHEAVRKVVALAEQRKMAPYDDLTEANDVVKRLEPNLFRSFIAQREQRMAWVRDLLSCLGEVFGPGESWLVGAGMPPVGDDDAPKSDRYLALLETLFCRVFALLRADDGNTHEVRVHVARRWVKPDGVPLTLTLRVQDVGDCVRRAERFPVLAPEPGKPDTRVRIVPHSVSRYDSNVRPGIVIADFAANRLRWPMSTARSWHELQARADSQVALPVTAPARRDVGASPLPALAAHGLPEQAIRGAAKKAQVLEVPWTPPGWTTDQARQWVAAVARWT